MLVIVVFYLYVKKIYLSFDRGIYYVFNCGVEMVEGDVVYFFGVDDMLNGIFNLVKVFVEFFNCDIDYVLIWVCCFDDNMGEIWFIYVSEKEGINVCY